MNPNRPDTLPLSGAILAGGRARRFGGRDKTELRVGPNRLRDRLLHLLGGFCREVMISSNSLNDCPGARIVRDRKPGQGPLGAIASCLEAARHPWLLVVAGDMPFISAPALVHLWRKRQGADVVIPRSPDGLQPLAALYHRRCLAAITCQLARGDYKIKDFFPAVRVRTITCTNHPKLYPENSFLNINSPDDLKKADLLRGLTPDPVSNPRQTPPETKLIV